MRTVLVLDIINVGEVLYTTGRCRGERDARATVAHVRACATEIVPADESPVLAAGDPGLRGIDDVPAPWIGDGPAPR